MYKYFGALSVLLILVACSGLLLLGEGCKGTAPADQLPPVAVVTANPLTGIAPLLVTFDASGSTDADGTIISYDWDFNDDGIYELLGGGAKPPSQTFTTVGNHRVLVRVTDDFNASTVAAITIQVVLPATWHTSAITGVGGINFELADVNGRPALAFATSDAQHFSYVVSSDALGTAWSTPVNVLTSDGANSNATALAVIGGQPAVAAYDGVNGIQYIRAADQYGTDWSTAPVLIVDDYNVFSTLELAEVDGRPAVTFNTGGAMGGEHHIFYKRADAADGSSWPAAEVDIIGAGQGDYPSLALVNGRPAVAFQQWIGGGAGGPVVRYAQAGDAAGSTWPAAVNAVNDPVVGEVDSVLNLALVAGRPAIVFNLVKPTGETWVAYTRAADADGMTDWSAPALLAQVSATSNAQTYDYSRIIAIGDTLYVAYHDSENSTLRCIRSNDAVGSSWQASEIVEAGTAANDFGTYLSLADIAGHAAIAYCDGNHQLRFAILY